jgi:hypothetical protein
MRLTFALVVAAALVASGVSSCLQTNGQRGAALRQEAEALLPPQAHIRALGFGDCVELADSPSCARVVFEMPEHSSALRAKRVREAAEANGWRVTRSGDAQGGWSLFLRRSGFTAYAVFWRPAVYGLRCNGGHPKDECFNTVNVERD